MLIKVDNRDSNLFDKCVEILNTNNDKYGFIKIEKELLPLGDIIIYQESSSDLLEKVIIERKSLPDLAASIRDGRYNEQSFRLQQCSMHNHNIFYVIEGDLRYYKPFKGNVDKKTLLSALVSLSYYKGFSVHRTFNLEETAEWIIQFAYKINKESGCKGHYDNNPISDPNQIFVNTSEDQSDISNTNLNTQANESYSEVCNRIKKNNITKENIGEIMLMQIPNVSSASAIAIMEKYKTMSNLLKALEESSDALNGIAMKNKNGDKRKISKTCISNIYAYLSTKESE